MAPGSHVAFDLTLNDDCVAIDIGLNNACATDDDIAIEFD